MEIAREIQIIKDRLNLGVKAHEITEINRRLDDLERAVGEIRAENHGILSRIERLEAHENLKRGEHGEGS